jgi:O-6-methylguanine DNA methyltransferase
MLLLTQVIDTPIGPLLAAAFPERLCLLEFNDTARVDLQLARACRLLHATALPGHTPLFDQLAGELAEYFSGQRRAFSIPLDPPGTPFQQREWQALNTIPYGQTHTYAQLAAQLGAPLAARAVGAANGQNPISILIPCHRLIGASGSLIKYGGGLHRKEFLIALENQKTA